ncbi:MAG: alkyl hydroperoxide reductase/Thiol specific antioxidant/Mal allergen [Chthoniobacteraceae bacterium]|nr:alkyl hydroperoxide reductase/Thiol specific antioxidant/Mal allergen [Chthoniobacteraceae bacterium]
MKTLLSALTAVTLLTAIPASSLFAAEKADPKAQVQLLIPKFQAKSKAGKTAEADYADELKELDALIAAQKDDKSDDSAGLVMLKAQIYAQLFEDTEKATQILKQLKTDYPDTATSKQADRFLEMMEKQAASSKIQNALKPGTQFPDFSENDINGKPLSIANYKGKVVLVDFWATWCGPCVAELPNVIAAYDKYHDKGFEIIGISLDSEKEKLDSFIASKKVTWPQFFDGQGWQNKLAAQYGVNSIPATYLLDKEGKIIAKGLRGEALGAAVAKALGEN